MSAVVACGSCGRRFQVGERKAGRTISCPNCGESIFVPTVDHQGALDLGGDDPGDDALASLLGPGDRPAPVAPLSPAAPSDSYALSPAAAPAPQAHSAAPVQYNAPLGAPGAAPQPNGFGLNAPAPAQADPLGTRPPPGKKIFKPIAQAPDWYFNPLWWAALLVPTGALIFVSMKLVERVNEPPPKRKIIKTIGTSPPPRSPVPLSPRAAAPPPPVEKPHPLAMALGTGVGVGPIGEEVVEWRVTADPFEPRVAPLTDKIAVPVGPDRRAVFAAGQAPYVAVRDLIEPGRVVLWSLEPFQEVVAWRNLPAEPAAECLSAADSRYACVAPSPTGFDLVLASTKHPEPTRAFLDWSAKTKRPPAYLGFAGSERLVVVAPSEREGGEPQELSVWDAVECKSLATHRGRWPTDARSYAPSPGGKYLAMMTDRRHFIVIDLTSGEEVALAMAQEEKGCRGLAWTSDGVQLAGVFASGELVVWDALTGKRISSQQVAAPPGPPATPGVQPIGRLGWLLHGKTIVDAQGGGSRPLFLEDSRQPARVIGGSQLVVTQERDGKTFILRDELPAPTAVGEKISAAVP